MTIDADGHFWYGLHTSVADPEKEETKKHAHEQLPLPKSAGEMAAARAWRSAQETGAINRVVWQQWFSYGGPRKLSARGVARWLGLSHTYVRQLVRSFTTNPSGTQRDARRHTTVHS